MMRNLGPSRPLFLIAVCLLLGSGPRALATPLVGQYQAVLRNDSGLRQTTDRAFDGVSVVDVQASAELPRDNTHGALTGQFALRGNAHSFGMELGVDAGHRITGSSGQSTVTMKIQDDIDIRDQAGLPLEGEEAVLRSSLVFHLSFTGDINFTRSSAAPIEDMTSSMVYGATTLIRRDLSPLSDRTYTEAKVIAGDFPGELLPAEDHLLDISDLLPPVSVEYPLHSSRTRLEWRITATTHATEGAIVMNAPNFFKIDSITFADGSTPESHGYKLLFSSGIGSPNIAVPEPMAVQI
jgi:hypothetical protein